MYNKNVAITGSTIEKTTKYDQFKEDKIRMELYRIILSLYNEGCRTFTCNPHSYIGLIGADTIVMLREAGKCPEIQCSITAIGSVVLQGAVNGLGSDIVAAQTAGSKAAQFLSVPLESIGTAMTTYTSQNMGAKDLDRVDRGVHTALGIGCVYSVASFVILRFTDKLLIGLFLEPGETAIMANAQSFIFWNSVFYIPLAVLIIYRYTIQGLGYSGLAMFAGVAEMVARAMVGFWFVPLWGYFAACIANPVAWFFACFFLIPAYLAVRRKLQREKDLEAAGIRAQA